MIQNISKSMKLAITSLIGIQLYIREYPPRCTFSCVFKCASANIHKQVCIPLCIYLNFHLGEYSQMYSWIPSQLHRPINVATDYTCNRDSRATQKWVTKSTTSSVKSLPVPNAHTLMTMYAKSIFRVSRRRRRRESEPGYYFRFKDINIILWRSMLF